MCLGESFGQFDSKGRNTKVILESHRDCNITTEFLITSKIIQCNSGDISPSQNT